MYSQVTTRTNLDKFYHDLNEWLISATKTLHDGSKTSENQEVSNLFSKIIPTEAVNSDLGYLSDAQYCIT